jgi:[ribosomal protein S5]-alanine N-acetyltransferase
VNRRTTVSPLTAADGPELLAMERENRAYFRELIGDRGDDWFATFEERHLDLVEANEAGEALMCVVRDEEGRLVGRMNLQDVVPEGGEVGYRIAEWAGGRGHATEALRQLLELADDRGVRSVEAVALVSNPASQRVLTANGFVEVAGEKVVRDGVTLPAIRFRRILSRPRGAPMRLPPHAGRELAVGAITGALTLVNPADLSPRALRAYRLTCATLSGAFAYTVLRDDDELTDEPVQQVAIAVGLGGAILGTMRFWERWDAKVHGWLVAHGVERPRLVLATAATATSLLSAFLDSGSRERSTSEEDLSAHSEDGPVQ